MLETYVCIKCDHGVCLQLHWLRQGEKLERNIISCGDTSMAFRKAPQKFPKVNHLPDFGHPHLKLELDFMKASNHIYLFRGKHIFSAVK